MSASGLLGLLVNVSAGPELQGLLSITLESLQVLSHEVALLRKENFELSQQINLLDYNLAGEELAPPPPEPADTKRAQNVTQCQTRAAEVAAPEPARGELGGAHGGFDDPPGGRGARWLP